MPSVEISDKLQVWGIRNIEANTIQQALRASRLDIVPLHVSLMPDAHVGIGSTVGTVIPTEGAIIPATVSVDIGCGMIAVLTNLVASDLPDNMGRYMGQAVRDIPAGVGQGHSQASRNADAWFASHQPPTKLSHEQARTLLQQFGSLGGGNHFYEICLDENDKVWLVLHSGSRGIGNKLAMAHISKAKKLGESQHLEDPDLAYFIQGTPEFDAYMADLLWCQAYAKANRDEMMNNALRGFFRFVGKGLEKSRINCHHNYTEQEEHFGRKLWITRKGAIRAEVGDYGVIPGSMGNRSYIVKGLGNPASFNSCSHGAGRVMSRGQARREIDIEAWKERMREKGIVWQEESANSLIDEADEAYKNIDEVMEDQSDLCEVVSTLHQIFNMKGTEGGRKRHR